MVDICICEMTSKENGTERKEDWGENAENAHVYE